MSLLSRFISRLFSSPLPPFSHWGFSLLIDLCLYDRLHYIPLSSSYKEIYNIHSFFSGPSESALLASNSSALGLPPAQRKSLDGDRKLRRIARAGKQWKKTIGRQVDMEGAFFLLPSLVGELTGAVIFFHLWDS